MVEPLLVIAQTSSSPPCPLFVPLRSTRSTMASAAVNEKAVNEEYKIWKKNTPFLYDLVMSHALEWPSLTVQWLPLKTIPTDSDYSEQKLVLGTHTSGTEQNFLMIAKAVLPLPETTIDARKFSEGATPGDVGGFGGPEAKIVIETRINHPGEVNRARYCPHNKFLIATKTVEGDVLVFDTIKHPPQPVETSVIDYQLSLRGHTKEGYGLEWSPNKLGYVASAADDGTICIWDTNATPEEAKQLDALHQLDAHSAVVEDVAWHAQHGEIFASVADNKQMMLWDLRELGAAKKPRQTVSNAHQSEINTVDFNPRNDFLLATGGADSVVKIWDMRKLDAGALHEFKGHDDEVVQAVWAPFGKGDVLASCACDRRVFVWDMSQVRSLFFLSCPRSLAPSRSRRPQRAPPAHPALFHAPPPLPADRRGADAPRRGGRPSRAALRPRRSHEQTLRDSVEPELERGVGHGVRCGGQHSAGVADGSGHLGPRRRRGRLGGRSSSRRRLGIDLKTSQEAYHIIVLSHGAQPATACAAHSALAAPLRFWPRYEYRRTTSLSLSLPNPEHPFRSNARR